MLRQKICKAPLIDPSIGEVRAVFQQLSACCRNARAVLRHDRLVRTGIDLRAKLTLLYARIEVATDILNDPRDVSTDSDSLYRVHRTRRRYSARDRAARDF